MWELIGPNKTLKNQPVCWQDGRVFADNESWIVDSCTKCICQVRFWKPSSLQKWIVGLIQLSCPGQVILTYSLAGFHDIYKK